MFELDDLRSRSGPLAFPCNFLRPAGMISESVIFGSVAEQSGGH